jgi:cell wall-associated NlpC family hydrolase
LPRTAQTQYDAGPRIPAGQPLLPGDLVFYGTPSNVHHVGLYIGAGLMIDAPDFGQRVKSEPYRETDYLGATRPAN